MATMLPIFLSPWRHVELSGALDPHRTGDERASKRSLIVRSGQPKLPDQIGRQTEENQEPQSWHDRGPITAQLERD